MDELLGMLRLFDEEYVEIRDYARVRRPPWGGGRVMPTAANRELVQEYGQAFLDECGDDFAEGLLFRDLVPISFGIHPQTGELQAHRYRCFVLDGEPLLTVPYWGKPGEGEDYPPVERFLEVARQVRSRFFTLELGTEGHGKWWILELEDGQACRLTGDTDTGAFYTDLRARLNN